MESLIVIRRIVGAIVLLGTVAGVCGSLESAADGNFTPLGLVLAGAFFLWLSVVVIKRRAAAPPPPKYSDSELRERVRAALQSKSQEFVKETLKDVSAQWGDNKDYWKLTEKLSALGGVRYNAAPLPEEGWDYGTLQRLYPNVYGDGQEGDLE